MILHKTNSALSEHVLQKEGFFFLSSASPLQRFHLLGWVFFAYGKWEFLGLTSSNPHDIQFQILEATKVLILTLLPVGFLPDVCNSCWISGFFLSTGEKKNRPRRNSFSFSSHHCCYHAPEFQAHETAPNKSLQQQEANTESIRLDQNQESLQYSSGKKSVLILGSRNLRVH